MDNNNNIDRIFESALGEAEFSHDSAVWENISQKLDSKPKVAVYKSRYKIFVSYAASIIVLAVTSILLIRSCNNYTLIASESNAPLINSKQKETNKPYADNQMNVAMETVSDNSFKNKVIKDDAKKSSTITNRGERNIKTGKSENINSIEKKNNYKTKDLIVKRIASETIKNLNNEAHLNSASFSEKEKANTIVFSDFKTISVSGINNFDLSEMNFKPDIFKYRIASNSTQSSIDFTFGPSNNFINGALINDNPKKYEYLTNYAQNSYNYSLNYKFELNSFFLKTGFNIINTGEIADLKITNRNNDTSNSYMDYNINQYYTYDSLDWWVDPNNTNDTLVIYKSTLHTDTTFTGWVRVDSIYYTKSNRIVESSLRYVELPFMLGYRQQIGNKFSLAMAGGIGLAIKAGDEGFFINEGELTKITKENTPYRNIAYNFILNMSLQYKLSSRISVIAVPAYRRNITSVYKEDFGIDRKYESYSFNFGINYIID